MSDHHRLFKQALSAFLTLAMVVGMVPASAVAEAMDGGRTSEGNASEVVTTTESGESVAQGGAEVKDDSPGTDKLPAVDSDQSGPPVQSEQAAPNAPPADEQPTNTTDPADLGAWQDPEQPTEAEPEKLGAKLVATLWAWDTAEQKVTGDDPLASYELEPAKGEQELAHGLTLVLEHGTDDQTSWTARVKAEPASYEGNDAVRLAVELDGSAAAVSGARLAYAGEEREPQKLEVTGWNATSATLESARGTGTVIMDITTDAAKVDEARQGWEKAEEARKAAEEEKAADEVTTPEDEQKAGDEAGKPEGVDVPEEAEEQKKAESDGEAGKPVEADASKEAAAKKKAEEEAAAKKKAEEEAAAKKKTEDAAKHPLATAPEGVDAKLADGVDLSSLRLLIEGVKKEDFTPDTQVLGEYEGLFLTQYETQDEARNAYLYYKHVKKATLVEPDVAVSVAEGETNEAPASSVAAKPMDEQTNPLAELADATSDGEVAEAAKVSERTYTVALVDTGYEGEGLVGATSVLGDATADDNGHGTDMAGYIRELDEDARILSIKALDATGTGTTASVYAAIKYAVEAKANVIDLSLSAWATEENVVVREAIDEATAAGVIVVGAAGNKGVNAKRTIPGGVESALVVGAADDTGERLPSSNFGDTVDAYVKAGSTSEAAARMSGWLSSGEVGSDWQAKLAEAIEAGTFSNGTAPEVAGPELPEELDPNFHAADDWVSIKRGRYQLRNNDSGYNMHVEGNVYSGTNSKIHTWAPYNDGNGTSLGQRWIIESYAGSSVVYSIRTAGYSYRLDIPGDYSQLKADLEVGLADTNSRDQARYTEAFCFYNSAVFKDGYRCYRIGVHTSTWGTQNLGYVLKEKSASQAARVITSTWNAATYTTGAYWALIPSNYTIKYDANGGSGAPGNQTIQLDSQDTISTTKPTRTGYTFKGWATSKTGSVVRDAGGYANGSTYESNLTTEDGTITLYAIWEKINVRLDLNGNLDGQSVNNISGFGTATVKVNGVTQKTNEPDYCADHPYDSGFEIKVTANEGRTVSGATVEGTSTYKVTTTKASGTAASTATITGTIGTSQVNVRATITKNTYKVKFNGNGSTEGSMNEQEFVYDTAQNLTANAFKRTGYTFKGWATSSTSTTVTYTDKKSVSKLASKYIDGQSTTLYAVWEPNYYTMSLDAQNNSGETDGTTAIYERYANAIYRKKSGTSYTEAMTGSANAITKPARNWKVSYNSAVNDGQTMQLSTTAANTTTNATFNGYYSATSGGTQYITANGFINTDNFKNTSFSANQTFYAQWGAGGKVTLPTPTMNHYTFDGWWTGNGGTGEKVGDAGDSYSPSADVTLYAKWNKTYFNVRFDANGGSGSFVKSLAWHEDASITGQSAPTRSGYVFEGFYDAKTGGNKVYNADLTYALTDPTTFHGEAATTYYAHWTPATYYVQFMGWDDDLQDDVVVEVLDADGNPTAAIPAADVPAGCQAQTFGSYTLPGAEELNLSRKHYNFVGWNIYPSQDWRMYEANKAYKGGLAQGQDDVVVLYAAWEPMDQYTISYDANGGSGKPATEEAYKGEDYVIPDAPGIKFANKKFLGWNTSVDGNGDWYYHGNAPKTIARGGATTVENFGYFTTANGEDPGYVSEDTASITINTAIPGDNVNHNTVLYAIWADWPRLSYHMNDGIGFIAPDYHEPFSTAALDFAPTHVPTRTGYDFVGWAERTGGEGTVESPYTYGPMYTQAGTSQIENFASDVTLYAQWEKQHMDVDATTAVDDVSVYLWNPGDQIEDGTPGAKIVDDTWVPYGDPYWFAVGLPKYYDGSNMTVTVNGTTLRSQGTKAVADDPETADVDETCTYYIYKVNTPVEPQSIDVSGIDELTYRVVLMPQGGTVDEDHNATSYRYAREGNNLPTGDYVTRPGYEFAGWFTNEECTEPEQALTAVPVDTKGDVAYYAKWEPLNFKVRYHSSNAHKFGADNGVSDDKLTYVPNETYSYTEAKRLVTAQSSDMFGSDTHIGTGSGNFVGWATSEEDRDNSVVSFTNEQRISGIVPSRAKAVYKYEVTKTEDAGTVTYELTTNEQWPGDEAAGYTVDDVTDPNSEHYFAKEGATVTVDGETADEGVTANKLATPTDQGYYLDLYAIWVPEYVWVHYDVNGAESSLASARHLKGDTIALPEQGEREGQVEREGYTLNGWNMSSNGYGPYAGNPDNENKPYAGNYDLTGDVWFQAQWTVGNYTVNFHRSGNDGNDPAMSDQYKRVYEMDQTYQLPQATGTSEGSLGLTPPKYDLATGAWNKNADFPETAAATRNVGDKVGITEIASDTTDETDKSHLNTGDGITSRKALQITEGETIYKYNLIRSTNQEGTGTYTITPNPSWPGDNAIGCVITNISDDTSPYYFTKVGADIKDGAGNVYTHEGDIPDSSNKIAVQNKIYKYNVTPTTTTTYTLTAHDGWDNATPQNGYTVADVTDTSDEHYFTAGENIVVKKADDSVSDATKNQVATKTTTETVLKYENHEYDEVTQTLTLTTNPMWTSVASDGSGYTVSNVEVGQNGYYSTDGVASIFVDGNEVEDLTNIAVYANQKATKTTTDTVYQYDVAKSTSTTYALTANPNWPKENEMVSYFVENVTDTSDPGYCVAGSSVTVGDQQQTVDANQVAYPVTTIYEWDFQPEQADMVFVGWATSAEKAGAGEAAFRNVALTDAFKVRNLTKTIGGEVNLYAVWAEKVHHYVVYDSNEGTWGTGGQTVASLIDEETFKTEYTDSVPTRVGYSFDKWATRTSEGTDGDPYQYAPVTAATTFSAEVGGAQTAVDSTVYAQWTPVTYHVVFNGDAYEADGTLVADPASAAPQEMSYDEETSLTPYDDLTAPFKSAAHVKSLKGWTTEKPTSPLAQGATDNRTIAYQDGQSVINLTSLAYDATPKTRTETVIGEDGEPTQVEVEYHDGEVNLYPVYEYDYVTVAYDSNGGTSLPAVTKLNGDTITLLKPTRDGYTLMGWVENTEQGENTELPVEGVAGIAGADYTPTSNVTLYAWWKKAETGHVLYKWTEGEEQKAQYLLDLNAYVVGEDSFVVAFDSGVTRREGYTFLGWINADDEGNPPHVYTDADDEQTRTLPFQLKSPAKDMTFLAQWEPISYKVTYDLNSADSAITEGEIPTRNVIFDNIKTDDEFRHTLLWNPTTDAENKANAPANKHFAGWATQATSTVADFPVGEDGKTYLTANLTSTPDVQITLYAVWAADTGTLAFDTNGGLAPKTDSITVTTGQAWPDLTSGYKPTRTGYVFEGYFDKAQGEEGATKVYDSDLVCQMSDALGVGQGETINLHAHWSDATYTVVYRGTNGEELIRQTPRVNTDYTLLDYDNPNIDIPIELSQRFQWVIGSLANKELEAYVLAPKNRPVIEGGVWLGDTPAKQGDIIELFANVIDKKVYNITYDANGGVYKDGFTPPVDRVTEGDIAEVQFDSYPTLKGYDFCGWSLANRVNGQLQRKKFYATQELYDAHESDPDRVAPLPGDEYKVGWYISSDSILYAIWEESTYQIVYHANNGTDATTTSDPIGYFQETQLAQNEFEYAEHKFLGWGLLPNDQSPWRGAGATVSSLTDRPTYDLYAIWAEDDVVKKEFAVEEVADQVHTGEEICPKPAVRLNEADEQPLVLNRDYVLAYMDNVDVGDSKVMVTGIGTYVGFSGEATFKIIEPPVGKTLNIAEVAAQAYTGSEIFPKPEVTVEGKDEPLVLNQDYLISYDNNVNVGENTAKIIVVGIPGTAYEGYYGSATFTIEPAAEKTFFVAEIADQVYTGEEICPKPAVKNGDDKLLALNRDYVLVYEDNIAVGTATVKVIGIGDYKDYAATTAFQIVEEVAADKTLTLGEVEQQTFTGEEICPTPQVTATISDEPVTLDRETDYELVYDNNVEVGTATITAVGKGAYDGYQGSTTFQIVADQNKTLTVGHIDDQIYTGSAITPTPMVKAGGNLLRFGTDYLFLYENNLNEGVATVHAVGIGVYAGYSGNTTFNITPAPEKTLVVSDVEAQYYTGSPVEPKPVVKDGDKVLKLNRDYMLAYENNEGEGRGEIYVTGIGRTYSGYEGFATFEILSVSLANATVSPIADETYDGTEHRPAITISNGDEEMVEDTDYSLAYSDNVNAGTAAITITGKGKFANQERTVNFKILPTTISVAEITGVSNATYTGSQIKPVPTVTIGEKTLILGTDYTLVYGANTYPGDGSVTVKGKGNYKDDKTQTFTIAGKNVSALRVMPIADVTYNGEPQEPTLTVYDDDVVPSQLLQLDTDYTVTYNNNVDAGTAYATITGTGNYAGTRNELFTIKQVPMPDAPDEEPQKPENVPEELFDGNGDVIDDPGEPDKTKAEEAGVQFNDNGDPIEPQKPESVATDPETGQPVAPDPTKYTGGEDNEQYKADKQAYDDYKAKKDAYDEYVAEKDLKDAYDENKDALDEYQQQKDAYEEAKSRELSMGQPADVTYNGQEQKPTPVVKQGDATLVAGADFDYSYENNKDVGTATVTATLKGNYAGTVSKTFKINTATINANQINIANVDDQTYTGSAITPKPAVTIDSTKLTEGTDFAYSYTNNVNAGTATVKVTLKGGYNAVTSSKTFKIKAKALPANQINVAAVSDQAYTGSAITPKPAVKTGSTTLREGADFTYSYSNNVNAGTATVTATLKGNYSGTASRTFKINAKALSASQINVAAIDDQFYTGREIKPKPAVTIGSTKLREGTDFEYSSYQNNMYEGTYANGKFSGNAKVTVTLKGNYSGSKSVGFTIKLRTFPDVNPTTSWARRAVSLAATRGLMNGYKNGNFGPDDNLTRGQVAVVLWNLAGNPAPNRNAKSFLDVNAGQYYYDAVRWASGVGVVNGYGNGNYGPDDPVTREQLAVMVANYGTNYAKLPGGGSPAGYASATDKDKVSKYAENSVGWCYKNKLMTSSTIRPAAPATRAETAAIVVQLDFLIKP